MEGQGDRGRVTFVVGTPKEGEGTERAEDEEAYHFNLLYPDSNISFSADYGVSSICMNK